MWAIIAILGFVLFLICIPAFVYALKKKKKGGIALYAVMAGISYCILLFGGMQAVSDYKAAQAALENSPVATAEDSGIEVSGDQAAAAVDEPEVTAVASEESAEQVKEQELEPKLEPLADLPADTPDVLDEIISDEIPDEVEPEAELSDLPDQLTASGGIGDTLSVLKDEYGYNSGDEKQASFKRGSVTAAIHPPSNRAYKIEYGYVGGVAGALTAITDMIPADSVQLDMGVGTDKVMISYRSEMLSQAIQQGDFVASFNVTKVGNNKLASYINISLGTFTSP
ncbi:hypothetical protein NYE70_21485 [Paenibacillus sp. FSL R5-0407]|uniref:hypothetical protein n=1 Tax=Paenibacillus sp. FSL R5-0407 TaxID=2975320 RepID=UPI0030F99E48